MKTTRLTIPELRRMKQLADAGMPCGSIAIALTVDFGSERTGDDVRGYLQRHFGWRAGKPRGAPFGPSFRSVKSASANNDRPLTVKEFE